MAELLYVPRGSLGLFGMFAEYDEPRRRSVVVRGPDGKELVASKAGQMFWKDQIPRPEPTDLVLRSGQAQPRPAPAHSPYFWAAFDLSGDWRE